MTTQERHNDGRAPSIASMPSMGVYVHFPWCLAKCPYCDFVSYAAARDAIDHAAYADAVVSEIDRRAPAAAGRRVRSVFFGGGTPSLWEPRELGRVLARVVRAAETVGDAGLEVTVECNPSSLDEDRARALLDVGVNRLSVGVQSLRDDRLRFLGRLHDADRARAALRAAQRAGAGRELALSADLIVGLPGQSPAEARDQAIELLELGLTHLSCYQLTIEPGTRFGELAKRGRLPLADEGAVADAFLAIDEALAARGLEHYEVSNYAKPGEEARHNLGYWRGGAYVGLGCAAYGFAMTGGATHPARGGGVRWRNATTPQAYVEQTRAMSGGRGCEAEREELDGETLLRERIMLG